MEPVTEGGSKGKGRAQEQLKCPRCKSSNTKFCYYNNYSLTQPRYFCKSCRRYWTDGGSLRNIPVGGGSRKNRKSPASVVLPAPTTTTTTHLSPPPPPPYQAHDLSLGFPATTTTGLENSHVGFGCYIPNLMPNDNGPGSGPGFGPGPGGGRFEFSFSDVKGEQNSSTTATYWNNNGMFGGAPW